MEPISTETERQMLTPWEEHQIIKGILTPQKKLKFGDRHYVIDSKWWSMWKDYVRYDEKEPKNFGQRPDKIDNDILLEDVQDTSETPAQDEKTAEAKESNSPPPATKLQTPTPLSSKKPPLEELPQKVLRKGLSKFDYELLPEEAWNYLVSWYEGGPPIPRQVISWGVASYLVELYPLSITVFSSSRTSSGANADIHFLFSRSATIRDVRRWVAGQYFMPPHKCTLHLVEELDKEPPALDINKTLEELGIEDGQTLLLKSASELSSQEYGPNSSSWSNNYSVGNYVSIQRREMNKEGTPPELGVTGLHNLGNTCFMNSVIQCLSHTNSLAEYFMNDAFTEEVNTSNPLGTKGELAREFGGLLKELWSGKFLHVVPRNFKKTLGTYAPQFSGYNQQDSQELLAYLLDGLHEDLNRVVGKHSTDSESAVGDMSEAALAKNAWDKYLQRNRSFIVDLFQGQYKSTVVCDLCEKTSITFDPFMYLSLPIPTTPYRLFEVVFFPMRGQPVKYGVRIPKLSDIKQLKTGLADMVGLKPEQIILGDVVGCKAFILDDWKYTFEHVRKSDITFGFEVLPPKFEEDEAKMSDVEKPAGTPSHATGNVSESENKEEIKGDPMDIEAGHVQKGPRFPQPKKRRDTGISNIQLLQRKVIPSTMQANFSRTELFGNPLMLSFDNKTTTNSQLRELVTMKLQDYLHITGAQLPKGMVPIRMVASSGRHCAKCRFSEQCAGCDLPNDDAIVDLDPADHAISLDWSVDEARVVFSDERTKMYIREDESLKLTSEEEKNKTVSLSDCLKLFNLEEKLTEDNKWHCTVCKGWSKATKKLDIWRLPEILIIHLKRFQYTSAFRDKLNEMVDFPEQLDMSNFVTVNEDTGGVNYELYAVSNHIGNLGSGHYTCFAKHTSNGKWYTYNDNNCTETDLKRIASNDAYILFYRRVPPRTYDIIELWKQKRATEKDNKKEEEQQMSIDKDSDKNDEDRIKREREAEDKDTPLNTPSNSSHNDTNMQMVQIAQQWSEHSNKQMVLYDAGSSPVPGDTDRSVKAKRDEWKQRHRTSDVWCPFCEQGCDSVEDLQVHCLTECGKFNVITDEEKLQEAIQTAQVYQRPSLHSSSTPTAEEQQLMSSEEQLPQQQPQPQAMQTDQTNYYGEYTGN